MYIRFFQKTKKIPIPVKLFPWETAAAVAGIAGSKNLVFVLCLSALLISLFELYVFSIQKKAIVRFRLLYIILPAIICCLVFIRTPQGLSCGMPLDQIREVSGIINADSVKTGSRGILIQLNISETYDDRTWTRCTAKGVISIILSNSDDVFYRGEAITCKGVVVASKDLWFVNQVERTVLTGSLPGITRWREFKLDLRLFFIKHIRNRIAFAGGETAQLLEMVILGFVDTPNMPLREVCKRAGCAHILALSGMHIQILASCMSFLLVLLQRKRGEGYTVACTVVLFVGIAGCRASLVRAAIQYILLLVHKKCYSWNSRAGVFFQTLFLQLILFPWTMTELSAELSYAALAGIIFISPLIEALAPGWIPEIITKALSASIGAVLATLPITGKYFGAVYLVGVIASPILAVLLTVFMASGLLYIVLFSFRAKILILFLEMNYQLIADTALFFSQFPFLHITGRIQFKIVIFEIILLTAMFSILYATTVSQTKRLKAYELGVPVRFSSGNCAASGAEWLEDDKKVWSEFSYCSCPEGTDSTGNSV